MGRRKQRIYVVVWNDAHSGEGGDSPWQAWDKKKHHKPRKIVSAGILLKENKVGITLTISKDKAAGTYTETIFVPTACIVEVTDVTPD